ncbi:MAG: hypothetical protein ACRDYA_12830 [Egibacteraceae bacterium]
MMAYLRARNQRVRMRGAWQVANLRITTLLPFLYLAQTACPTPAQGVSTLQLLPVLLALATVTGLALAGFARRPGGGQPIPPEPADHGSDSDSGGTSILIHYRRTGGAKDQSRTSSSQWWTHRLAIGALFVAGLVGLEMAVPSLADVILNVLDFLRKTR